MSRMPSVPGGCPVVVAARPRAVPSRPAPRLFAARSAVAAMFALPLAGQAADPDGCGITALRADAIAGPLDDRIPRVVLAVPPGEAMAGLIRLQQLRQARASCARLVLGIGAPVAEVLAMLRELAGRNPMLLAGIVVVPFPPLSAAAITVRDAGRERRLQRVIAALASLPRAAGGAR